MLFKPIIRISKNMHHTVLFSTTVFYYHLGGNVEMTYFGHLFKICKFTCSYGLLTQSDPTFAFFRAYRLNLETWQTKLHSLASLDTSYPSYMHHNSNFFTMMLGICQKKLGMSHTNKMVDNNKNYPWSNLIG